jgi:hypothetical protein
MTTENNLQACTVAINRAFQCGNVRGEAGWSSAAKNTFGGRKALNRASTTYPLDPEAKSGVRGRAHEEPRKTDNGKPIGRIGVQNRGPEIGCIPVKSGPAFRCPKGLD